MTGTYDRWLVLLSLLVAIFASYTALDLASRITSSRGIAARWWLCGGAFSMGTGIWSMHFIGMLAFSLPVPMGYSIPVTLLSMLIAIVVSGFALYMVSRDTLRGANLVKGGILMGFGISAMHYTGMFAMEAYPPIHYDPWLFTASVGIAIVASIAALWIAFTLRSEVSWWLYARLLSAIVMGVAITGMHYTGMAAARFAPDTICLTGAVVDNSWMAGAIAAITFIVLCVTLALSTFDSHLASETARMAASLKVANEELQHAALHDGLTRLPNRLLLEDRIGRAIAIAERTSNKFAVMFVDLDRFKIVNDSLGHFVGDDLLKGVSERLLHLVRNEDTVSRLGGDEFVILLRAISRTEDAAMVAGKILNAVKAPIRVQDHELSIGASIGISLYPLHGKTAQELITKADAAMYQAKSSGRNQFQVFGAEMSTFFPERLALENDLRHALERGEFELHYQPKFGVSDGAMTGMEALLRWRHSRKGLIAPGEFIPLAEETGLILPIGDWVLREACAHNKVWHDKGLAKVRVAVNISGVQFRQKDLLTSIEAALDATGLAPENLELEITESVAMQDAARAEGVFRKLGEMGVRISIDDFGTGYSSLGYLRRFPIHTLKVDRSFIRELPGNADDAAIVSAIIALGHNLRLKVVAEGVESEAQLQLLRSLGADEFQGYLRSRPVPVVDFERFLAVLADPSRNTAHPGTESDGRLSTAEGKT